MKYIEAIFQITPETETAKDILSSLLGEIGFESFVYNEGGMEAYIQKKLWNEELLAATIAEFPLENVTISYKAEEAEDKNWNEEWEKNFFQPIVIKDRCVIHSTFHKNVPQAEYDILINPQMAFGTGHHETTSLMIEFILETDMTGKRVLDMGCGTSILAILASMKGAAELEAIDIDNWCVENSRDNFKLNNITNITAEEGDASLLAGKKPFDVIIANINRNILTNDMHAYTACLKDGGVIFFSGFYTEDIPVIRESAEKNGLTYVSHKVKNNWSAVMFRK